MNKIYKAALAVSAVAVMASAMIIPVSVHAWGDSANGRRSYTIAEIEAGALGDTITFDSISDGKFGDEKNFVGAKLSSQTANSWNQDEINVKDGETYTIRLYVHNNSPKGYERIAEGVKVSFAMPTMVGKSHTIVGYIDSSNATPNRYWDEVTLKSDSDFFLEYVRGSADYTNAKGTTKLPDEVITSGALVGYEKMDGKIPGCFEFDGYATIKVKVHKGVASKLNKMVRIKGASKSWEDKVTAKVGQEVEYQIEYQNLLGTTANNVMIRDILPTNVEYVQNSTYLYNGNHPDGILLSDNTLTTDGINIGNYKSKANAFVRFTAKVVDKSLVCGSNQLVNWANSTVNGAVSKDDASVMVNKECGPPLPPPDEPDPDDPKPDPDDPKPDPDDPKPDDPTPPTPDEPGVIVDTGAGTIVTGTIGAGSMVTSLGYYVASRKKLMKK